LRYAKVFNVAATLLALATSASAQQGVTSEGMVAIKSITPAIGQQLVPGERVRVVVNVQYSHPGDKATLALHVQEPAPSNYVLAQTTQVVSTAAGNVTLAAEFMVPSTRTVQVFVPLYTRADRSTAVVDTRVYEVAAK